jgi:hypothetical protein
MQKLVCVLCIYISGCLLDIYYSLAYNLSIILSLSISPSHVFLTTPSLDQ